PGASVRRQNHLLDSRASQGREWPAAGPDRSCTATRTTVVATDEQLVCRRRLPVMQTTARPDNGTIRAPGSTDASAPGAVPDTAGQRLARPHVNQTDVAPRRRRPA